MIIDGYEGICTGCFEPIKNGDGFKFRESGRSFHKWCVESNPNGYYIKLEEIEGRFETASQEELPRLMTELEQAYSIPMLNNEVFNRDNEDVIKLYRRISSAREL
ncbi:hypothetical protein [Desulfosporosinus lacus]|uniref:Uncharacterized protein n=1 Tax=Desulfosporosinus lacus DSM 15449 TaxID=1121420 RepID=A0A1M5WEN4_9FIRM|nr:hypothetical protein [Desulfosporosinus lacus]SHH85951.1 hypothetical protein SAMN02746098_01584 [Desulfosporosinus lacus DSM 15449]